MVAAILAACGSAPKRSGSIDRLPGSSSTPPARGGGYYLDDGPGAQTPADLEAVPDAVPRVEPLLRGTMRPYVVMGQDYTPMTRLVPYKARGIASWYGRRYHGKQTSSGEIYDMYGMTAAHTVLPIPSYVRVTSLVNGKSVVLRVNDRGPFINDRLIDLSYTAAYKLGILGAGSGMVEVESIIPGITPPPPPVAVAAVPVPPVTAAVTAAVAATPAVTAAALPPTPPETAATAPAPTPVATAAAAPVPAPAAVPAPVAVGNSFVQFGAFGVRENAESYVVRLQAQADWLSGLLNINHSDGIYRVQAGPYVDEAAARNAAARAEQSLGVKPVIITR